MRIALAVGALAAGLAGAPAASATSITPSTSAAPASFPTGFHWCDNPQPTGCMNAWFGGPNIKSYAWNINNEDFHADQGGGGPCDGYETTANCPWSGTPAGIPIVQLSYTTDGQACSGDEVGDLGNSQTNAQTGCVPPFGWGDNWLLYYDPSACGSSTPWLLLSVHWSSSWVNAVGLGSFGGNGKQLYNNSPPQCLNNSF